MSRVFFSIWCEAFEIEKLGATILRWTTALV
jgi:hypothetical protein